MAGDGGHFQNLDGFMDNEEEETDNENKFKNFSPPVTATLYFIDTRQNMFIKGDGEEHSPFELTMKSLISCLKKKIFTKQHITCGIVLLGTDKTDNKLNLKHVTVIAPLVQLGADHIISCMDVLKALENGTFRQNYGHGNFKLADSFWLGSHLFSQTLKSKFNNKSIVVFTNDDNPYENDPTEKQKAFRSAVDLYQHSISVDLIHIGLQFNADLFYKEVLKEAAGDPNVKIPNPVTTIQQITDRLSKVNHRHISLVKVPFSIAPDFEIGVAVYQLVKKMKPPFKIKLSKSTNEPVQTKLQLFMEETGEVLQNENIQKFNAVSGKEISFSVDELKSIKSLGERGFKLMGFKPSHTVQLEHFIRPSAFIYPDESYSKGSTSFFTALLKRCKAKDVIAICSYYPRPGSPLRFVALVPHEEVVGDDQFQISPSGFIVVFLPFADEIRDLDEKCVGKRRADPEQVAVAAKIVKKLKFDYKPDCFTNPKIASHWAAIDALALNLKEKEEVTDDTLPDYDHIKSRLKTLPQEFKAAVYSSEYNPEVEIKPQRKPRETIKATEKPEIDNDVIEQYARSGEINKLRVEILKSYCQSVGIKGVSKMKKADLIHNIQQHLHI